jgi:hypothetical protein
MPHYKDKHQIIDFLKALSTISSDRRPFEIINGNVTMKKRKDLWDSAINLINEQSSFKKLPSGKLIYSTAIRTIHFFTELYRKSLNRHLSIIDFNIAPAFPDPEFLSQSVDLLNVIFKGVDAIVASDVKSVAKLDSRTDCSNQSIKSDRYGAAEDIIETSMMVESTSSTSHNEQVIFSDIFLYLFFYLISYLIFYFFIFRKKIISSLKIYQRNLVRDHLVKIR